MSIINTRICDQCEVAQDEQVSWMTLTFPLYRSLNENMPEQAPEYDFCSYACLQLWINEDDTQVESEQPTETKGDEVARLLREAGDAVPPMTLAEALTSGQLTFNREG